MRLAVNVAALGVVNVDSPSVVAYLPLLNTDILAAILAVIVTTSLSV